MLCKPDCKECGGLGYIRYDVPMDHPKFGKAEPCHNLPPDSRLFNNFGLSLIERRTLTWKNVKNRENVEDAIKILKNLIKSGSGMAYLWGDVGLAKTLLLKTACAEWIRTGNGFFYFTNLADILEDLRSAYDDAEPQRALSYRTEKYLRFPLLAIDEAGAERKTEFGSEKFFTIMNKRHEMGTEQGLQFVTLLAGNVAPSELDRRISDRFRDGRNSIIKLTGESYRPLMENQS